MAERTALLTGKSIAQLCSDQRTSERFFEIPTRLPNGLNTQRIAASRANQNMTTQKAMTAISPTRQLRTSL